MKNILVPIGSSKSAVSNLQYAIDLAHEMEAYVYLISVFQEVSKVGGLTKVNAIIKEDTQNRLDEVLAQVDKKDVTIIAHPIKGSFLESINRVSQHVDIDLMVLSPRSNSIREEVYLGNVSGKLLKGTDIPILIVPEGAKFKQPASMLLAFKNGNFEKKKMLEPVRQFTKHFGTELHLLHVETPETTEEMKEVSKKLTKLQTSYAKAENGTTYQAVLAHYHDHNADMLCVVRRKRGFFKKLWEKNVILKKEFYTDKPLLVLQVQD
ncbi:universal stress protein [Ulvibacter antarcticus]|uniref:Nucleotide-binding universal stress UspA family protein n=1 Tax=Ulvibacter antarcticus TaxID=442714 RepID=A0A3L9Z0P8_9FLAO|nr:universal stress protein [Ulvibacter antarcticus]RMA66084.1 nucleotide-binding universal stress UspA family protein [Ulvibacter antarcticus]